MLCYFPDLQRQTYLNLRQLQNQADEESAMEEKDNLATD